MNHATTCKYCRKPITVEIDDAYADLGDPHKLIPMAACNRCADIRVERRVLEAKVKFACMMLHFGRKKFSETKVHDTRVVLERLLKQYANMIARWHFLEGMSWDDEALNLIMDKPDAWASVLKELWKMFTACNPERA